MIDGQVLTFAAVAAVLTVTPGADTMLVVRNVVRGGRHDGVVTTLGICCGVFVHAVLSALGVSVVLMHSATAFHVIKLAGAGYLIWLGAQSLRAALGRPRHAVAAVAAPPAHGAAGARRCFAEGCLSNVLNPKVAVFYLAFLPQFIGPADPALARSLMLASIHFAEGVVWLATLAVMVDRARRLLMSGAARRVLDGLCGLVLVGFGARLALERR
jgi:RhtB (resistance to homoserine/threonine) family protein